MAIALLVTYACVAQAQTRPWMDRGLPASVRADLLISSMRLDEKIQQVAMETGPNTDLPNCEARRDSRHLAGVERLGIPVFRSTNGPTGVGGGDCNPDRKATAVPTGLAVAATWDTSAAYRWGDIAGREVRANGHHAFYAPGVNLARVPEAGRNFEYFGEDPFLAGRLAAAQTRAIQAHGVQAVGKHFVANEQETQRTTMNVIVDERTLHEIYLLPFEMMIRDGDMASVMCSYPRVNGTFSCENAILLEDTLRKQLGFKGYVVSDRGATNSTAASIKAGLDLELNSAPKFFTKKLIEASLDARQIGVEDLDKMLRRRYTSMFQMGQFDRPIVGVKPIDFQSHGQTARAIAEEGAVLLKNDAELLPLNARSLRRIAVIGPSSLAGEAKVPATGPAGQVRVNAPYTVTPLKGMRDVMAMLSSDASVTYDDGSDLDQAVALAKSSDAVIVMVGDQAIEGVDRLDLTLPVRDNVNQNSLVAALSAVNSRTVVVLKISGAVVMPWLDKVRAVLAVWQPGQEDGHVVANLLFGIANPSGKLPLTFPNRSREVGGSMTVEQWPGVEVEKVLTSTYSERLQMGYRWYQAQRKTPLFPFGFGLSYTNFVYVDSSISNSHVNATQPTMVSVQLRNAGTRAGAEVVQVYASFDESYGEPPRRLVGFQKVMLSPGETRKLSIEVDASASHHPFSYWNVKTGRWEMMTGKASLYVSRSSAQVESKIDVDIQ